LFSGVGAVKTNAASNNGMHPTPRHAVVLQKLFWLQLVVPQAIIVTQYIG
jgi:hypothetical protein